MTAGRLACALAASCILVALTIEPAVATQAQRATASGGAPFSPHLRNGACAVAGLPRPAFGAFPPVVPVHPRRVTLTWTPGLNDKSCKAVRSDTGAAVAAVLARDIDAAPPVPSAQEVVCPLDEDTRVVLFFAYRHQTFGPVTAQLDGCGWIFTTGSEMRELSTGVRNDLMSLAPKGWKRFFDQ